MPILPILNSLEFYNCSRLFPMNLHNFFPAFPTVQFDLTSQAKCSHLIASVPGLQGVSSLETLGWQKIWEIGIRNFQSHFNKACPDQSKISLGSTQVMLLWERGSGEVWLISSASEPKIKSPGLNSNCEVSFPLSCFSSCLCAIWRNSDFIH